MYFFLFFLLGWSHFFVYTVTLHTNFDCISFNSVFKRGKLVLQTFSTDISKMKTILFLSIFQVLLTGATLGPEINSLCRQQGCFHVLFVSGCLDWSGVRFWKIDKIIQVFRGLFLLFTPYLSIRELFDSTETDFKVHRSLS